MSSGHGVDKPRREGDPNRLVHRERFTGAHTMTIEEYHARMGTGDRPLTGGVISPRRFVAQPSNRVAPKNPEY